MCDCGHLPGVLTHRSIASSCVLVRFRSNDIGGHPFQGDRVHNKKGQLHIILFIIQVM